MGLTVEPLIKQLDVDPPAEVLQARRSIRRHGALPGSQPWIDLADLVTAWDERMATNHDRITSVKRRLWAELVTGQLHYDLRQKVEARECLSDALQELIQYNRGSHLTGAFSGYIEELTPIVLAARDEADQSGRPFVASQFAGTPPRAT